MTVGSWTLIESAPPVTVWTLIGDDGTAASVAQERGASRVVGVVGATGSSIPKTLDSIATFNAANFESFIAAEKGGTGLPGTTYTLDTTPYPRGSDIVLQGGELYNANATAVATSDVVNVALALGTSHPAQTNSLTFYGIDATSGTTHTLGTGEGANFSVGDIGAFRGASYYYNGDTDTDNYRQTWLSRVIAVYGDDVTFEDALPQALLDDTPEVANADEGYVCTAIENEVYHILYRPHVSNLKLRSLNGETHKWGGIKKGVFRDIDSQGRNGLVFNALHGCLFENWQFQAWRKLFELTEGSRGTTVRGLRGCLYSIGSDAATGFLAAIQENSHDNLVEDFDLDAGYASATNAVQFGAGTGNTIRKGVLRLPNHTGNCLVMQDRADAGMTCADNEFADMRIIANAPLSFIQTVENNSGLIRPRFRNLVFEGTPTSRAATIVGANGGLIENVYFPSGAFLFNGTTEGWTFRNMHVAGGFSNLNAARLAANTFEGCTSDASIRLAAAAVVDTDQLTISSTTTNNTVETMTAAAGDLVGKDEVHFQIDAITGASGGNARHIRVTCNIDGATDTEVIDFTETGNSVGLSVEGKIYIRSNTSVFATAKGFGTSPAGKARVIAGNLSANGMIVKVQMWTETSGTIIQSIVKVVPQPAGLKAVRVF